MIIPCTDCGACCAMMESPPFIGRTDPEYIALPDAVRADYDERITKRAATGWPPDVPCFWLTSEKRCMYYEHRPEICRELELGSEGCQSWRYQFNIKPKQPAICYGLDEEKLYQKRVTES